MTEKEQKKKKEIILNFMNDPSYVPMRKREMVSVLQVPREAAEEFSLILEEILADGQAVMDTRGRYHVEKVVTVAGTFHGTTREFGFVTPEDEAAEDIFIDAGACMGALNGDRVRVVVFDTAEEVKGTGKRRTGRVVEILERANAHVVGTFFKKKEFGFVVAEDKRLGSDIFIDGKNTMGAVSGHKVVVKVTDFGDGRQNPEGKIEEIIGHINDPESDVTTILHAFGISTEFPEDVLAETAGIPESLTEDDISRTGRLDLRDELMITIDGEDAKDLDDAVSLRKTESGYVLGVHIADVSEYVKENHPLDVEAKERGTSVYLINRVVPMLPHRLSNGICSLNAGEDRLALSCIMELDEEGAIVGHRLAETIIHVDRRTSYTEVAGLLELGKENGGGEEMEDAQMAENMQRYGEILPMVLLMGKVSALLRDRRMARGAIDFDFPESKILLDEKGAPVEIKPYERNDATRLIEEFMLAANETVAEEFYWLDLPFVYRVHESPDEEKIKRLGLLLQNFGYYQKWFRMPGGNAAKKRGNQNGGRTERGGRSRNVGIVLKGNVGIHPKMLQEVLAKADGSPEEALVARLALRSMKQAKYMAECEGHFGLAAKYYCHFTSPIRRYPDLQIHRIIKEYLRGNLTKRRIEHYQTILPGVAGHSSKMERLAVEAERELEKMKKCEYAQGRIGERAEGIISGITSYGMYVELDNTVEGCVRLADLDDDFYFFDEENYQLVGERGKKVYRLGQRLTVEIYRVDKILKTIDFLIASR